MQANFDIGGLVEALKNSDAGIRRRAAAALRALDAKTAVPALKEALLKEDDSAVLKSLQEAVSALDTSEESATPLTPKQVLFNELIGQLQSLASDQVVSAAEQLGELGNKLAVEPLVLLFNNLKAPIQVRLAVAEALIKLESAPVEVALLANLRHPSWHIRRNGAAILGQLKAEWAIEPLGRALFDPHETVRKTATAALKYIGTPEARKILARFATGILQRRAPDTRLPTQSRLLDKMNKPAAGSSSLSTQVMPVSKQIKPATTDGHNLKTDHLDSSALDDIEKRRKSGDS